MSKELSYKEINGYKSHKFIDLFNKRTGRIKRMRSRRESRYVNLAKRVGKKAYSFNSDFCSNLTRWNRH